MLSFLTGIDMIKSCGPGQAKDMIYQKYYDNQYYIILTSAVILCSQETMVAYVFSIEMVFSVGCS